MDGAEQLYLETTAAVTKELRRGMSDEDWHARSGPPRIDCNGQAPPASVVDELKRYHQGDPGDETEPRMIGTKLETRIQPASTPLPMGKVVFKDYRPPLPPTSDQIVRDLSQHIKAPRECQLERRRAWARFAAAAFELSELSELSECRPFEMTVGRASRAADLLLAEYDRRFGA